MDKVKLNKVLNITLYCAFLGLVFTGILLAWALPHGASKHEWAEIHEKLAIVITLGVLAHLWLHWAWIRSFFNLNQRRKAGLWIAALGLALALLLPWVLPVGVSSEGAPEGRGEQRGWQGQDHD